MQPCMAKSSCAHHLCAVASVSPPLASCRSPHAATCPGADGDSSEATSPLRTVARGRGDASTEAARQQRTGRTTPRQLDEAQQQNEQQEQGPGHEQEQGQGQGQGQGQEQQQQQQQRRLRKRQHSMIEDSGEDDAAGGGAPAMLPTGNTPRISRCSTMLGVAASHLVIVRIVETRNKLRVSISDHARLHPQPHPLTHLPLSLPQTWPTTEEEERCNVPALRPGTQQVSLPGRPARLAPAPATRLLLCSTPGLIWALHRCVCRPDDMEDDEGRDSRARRKLTLTSEQVCRGAGAMTG